MRESNGWESDVEGQQWLGELMRGEGWRAAIREEGCGVGWDRGSGGWGESQMG